MPRGGHNSVPTRIREARGTAQPCRMNENEPTPDAVDALDPELPLEGQSLEMFNRLARSVGSLGILHSEHAHKLTLAAMAYGGAFSSWQEGDMVSFAKLSGEFRQLIAGYGLDPATMTKVGAAPRAPQSEREKLEAEFFGPN